MSMLHGPYYSKRTCQWTYYFTDGEPLCNADGIIWHDTAEQARTAGEAIEADRRVAHAATLAGGDSEMSKELQYGLGHVVPDEAKAAWGARMIVTQDGMVDVVWDRTDAVGEQTDKDLLLDALNEQFPMPMMRRVISSKLSAYELRTREAADVVLFDDMGVKVVCNTNASAGYLYVAAWLTTASELLDRDHDAVPAENADHCQVCGYAMAFDSGHDTTATVDEVAAMLAGDFPAPRFGTAVSFDEAEAAGVDGTLREVT